MYSHISLQRLKSRHIQYELPLSHRVFILRNMTKGQIEDALSKEVTKFYAKSLGMGPKETRVYIVQDMIIIRLKGKLLPIEETLLSGKGGISAVKNLRELLHETFVEPIGKLIKDITAHDVISMHGDISTKTGERLEVFILDTNFEEELTASNPR
jgi:uncharacterized protein YbcI